MLEWGCGTGPGHETGDELETWDGRPHQLTCLQPPTRRTLRAGQNRGRWGSLLKTQPHNWLYSRSLQIGCWKGRQQALSRRCIINCSYIWCASYRQSYSCITFTVWRILLAYEPADNSTSWRENGDGLTSIDSDQWVSWASGDTSGLEPSVYFESTGTSIREDGEGMNYFETKRNETLSNLFGSRYLAYTSTVIRKHFRRYLVFETRLRMVIYTNLSMLLGRIHSSRR